MLDFNDNAIIQTNELGQKYCFCPCGMVVWGGVDRLCKKHIKGYKHPRTGKKRFSGYSSHQNDTGGFQRSNRA